MQRLLLSLLLFTSPTIFADESADGSEEDAKWDVSSDQYHTREVNDPYAVSDEAEHIVHNPSWSPDGDYLVGRKSYYSTRSIAAGEIWMFHHGGGNGVNLVERPNADSDQKNRAEPAY